MDKKIGKWVLSFLILCAASFGYSHNKKIDVILLDKQQMPLRQAEIGIPFLLQLVAENMTSAADPVGLQSGPDYSVQYYGSSQSVSIINGYRTQKNMYNFLITCDRKGTFDLGPVTITDGNGDVLTTGKITISVGDLVEPKYNNREPYLFMLETDKQTAYIGEKITVTVRFCYQKNFENLAIDNFAIKNARIGYQSNIWQRDTFTIGSTQYDCKQMYFELYPEKVGTLIIPGMQATFIPEQHSAQQISNSMFSMFGLATTRAVQSHPRSVEILPLPHSAQYLDVSAVGQFEKATLSINQSKGQVGEGLVVTMKVTGDGNLEITRAPAFALPEGLHCYEGNSSVNRIDQHHEEKTFEWIVQADRGGNFEIPRQSFCYFDPVKKTYKTLHTSSLSLTISGEAINSAAQQQTETLSSAAAIPEKPQQTVSDDMGPCIKGSVRNKNRVSSLLSSVIVLCGLLLLIIIIGFFLRPYAQKTFVWQSLYYRYKFWQVCTKNNQQELYHFFQELADVYGFNLQDDSLKEIFEKLSLPEETFKNWQNFVAMLLESNFAKMKSEQDVSLAVHLAKQWFPIILLCCKVLYKKQIV